MRLVRTPEATVAFDLQRRLPGRGAWVCLSRECLSKALSPRTLGRTFHAPTAPVPVDHALRDLSTRIAARIASLLETAARSNGLETGTEAVLRLLTAGRIHFLFLASDLSPRTRRRFDGIDPSVPVSFFINMEDLGRAVRHPGTGVAGVTNPSLAAAISRELTRMDRLQQPLLPSGGVST